MSGRALRQITRRFGQLYHKATPEGRREDFTPEPVDIVEHVTAPVLAEFNPVGSLAISVNIPAWKRLGEVDA